MFTIPPILVSLSAVIAIMAFLRYPKHYIYLRLFIIPFALQAIVYLIFSFCTLDIETRQFIARSNNIFGNLMVTLILLIQGRKNGN